MDHSLARKNLSLNTGGMNEGSALPLSRKQRFWNQDSEPAPLGSERSDHCPRRRTAASFLWFLEGKPWGSRQGLPTPSLQEQEPWSPWYPRPRTQPGGLSIWGQSWAELTRNCSWKSPQLHVWQIVCVPALASQDRLNQYRLSGTPWTLPVTDWTQMRMDHLRAGKRSWQGGMRLWSQLCYPCLKPCQDIPELETK